MKSLEQIAKKMFSDFAMKRSGHYLDWRYLSPDRQLQWMKEVAETRIECLEILKEELSVGKLPTPGAASYERGFVNGQAHEANRLVERINLAQQATQAELDRFIEQEASK